MERLPSPSRRTFLSGMLAVGGTAIGAKMAEKIQKTKPPTEYRSEEPRDVVEFSEPHPRDTPWEQGSTPPTQEQTDAQEIRRFRSDLARFQNLFQEHLPDAEGGIIDSLQTQAEARAFLLGTTLPARLTEIAGILARSPSARGHETRSLFNQTLQTFYLCGCQGLVYSALQKATEATKGKTHFERDAWYYGSRVRDYTPCAKDIWSQDIDPRNNPNANEADRRRMRAEPAWAGKRRKVLFRTLAEKPSLIERAKREDLTIVEFFSLIKSIVHEQARLGEEQKAHTSLESIADHILSTRRETLQRALLSPQTQKAILFYGDDRRFMHGAADTTWDGPLQAADVSNERIEKIGTSETQTNANVLQELKHAIASSRGKTFIAFKTHGSTDGLYIDSQRGTEHISDRAIAEALIARIQTTRSPSTLEEVNIVVDACHSYEFRNNVVRIMEELWQTSPMRAYSFERVAKPFFVTVVQEGSVGQAGSLIGDGLDAQVSAIQKDGAVYIKRLLQCVQPRLYEENDMTFFASGTGQEFAQRETAQTSQHA